MVLDRLHGSVPFPQAKVSRAKVCDLQQRTGEFGAQVRNVPISLARRNHVAGITPLLNNWIFSGENSNITNLSWMRIMDKSLISSIQVGDMGEKASKMIHRFWPIKSDFHF
jgi:hypothetical protein